MKIILESVVYAGSQKRKDGKETLTFVEDGKIRKVTTSSVLDLAPLTSLVDVELEGVTSVFANFGDLNINSRSVSLREVLEVK